MFFGCERRETSCGSGPDRAHHAVPHSRQKRHSQRCCRSLLSSSTLSSTVHAASAYRTRPCFFSNQILNLLSLFHIECFLFFFLLFFSHTFGSNPNFCDFILFSGLFPFILLLFARRYICLFSISPLIYKTSALVTCV